MAFERQTQPFTSSRASQGARQITGACPTHVATQRVEPRAPCRERSGCRTKGHWEPERPLERRTSHRRVFRSPTTLPGVSGCCFRPRATIAALARSLGQTACVADDERIRLRKGSKRVILHAIWVNPTVQQGQTGCALGDQVSPAGCVHVAASLSLTRTVSNRESRAF